MPSITVGVAAVDVIDRDAKRKTISFFNSSGAGQVIYISKQKADGTTVANSEYPLPPNSGLDFDIGVDGGDIRGSWCAIASAAGGSLYYSSTSEREVS